MNEENPCSFSHRYGNIYLIYTKTMLRRFSIKSALFYNAGRCSTDRNHRLSADCWHCFVRRGYTIICHPPWQQAAVSQRRKSFIFHVQSGSTVSSRTLCSKQDKGDSGEAETPFVVTNVLPPDKKKSDIKKEATEETKATAEGSTKSAAEKLSYKSYKEKRRKVDYTKSYTDNNTLTAVRAMNDYLLKSSDLEQLRQTARRSPYDRDLDQPKMMVYLRSDVENKAVDVWGSIEALEMEKKRRKEREAVYKEHLFLLKRAMREYDDFYVKNQSVPSMFEGPGKVVLSAIAINTGNFVFKLIAWLYSGSSSMFSEAIHSAADVCNQIILALGIRQSIKKPSRDHPYGYSNIRYVTSLISGVGVFCVGAGLSFYHGIMGLMHPEPIESLLWSYCILGGSLLTEGATLSIAINAIKKGSLATKMSFREYVWRARDPSVNVVLLEDAAAVLGVLIAASCMGLTSLTGNPMYDSMGALGVGTLLGAVSGFLIYTNTEALVGRSIPDDQLLKLSEVVENDVMVRGVYDVKATDMGVNTIRFKAELDFDGAELTRSYLDTQDLEVILKDIQSFKNLEDVEAFMLRHGERIIDQLGAEVDRIEKLIKKANPEVRHVDLEIL